MSAIIYKFPKVKNEKLIKYKKPAKVIQLSDNNFVKIPIVIRYDPEMPPNTLDVFMENILDADNIHILKGNVCKSYDEFYNELKKHDKLGCAIDSCTTISFNKNKVVYDDDKCKYYLKVDPQYRKYFAVLRVVRETKKFGRDEFRGYPIMDIARFV